MKSELEQGDSSPDKISALEERLSNIEREVKHSKGHVAKSPTFWVSVVAAFFAGFSALNSYRSANQATRSADASSLSANAAKTNADWITYQRTQDHDVIAKVLQVIFHSSIWRAENTNDSPYIDLALMNRGNQSEIIRRVDFYYSTSTNNPAKSTETHVLNLQLPKGDKEVLHFTLNRKSIFTGKLTWLSVGVTAISPDGEDLESEWKVSEFNISTNGGESRWETAATNQVRVISNTRESYQRKNIRID
ncbi:MAG TPA: hypothetical protein VG938_13875 [Verrucomicrobiae bacterium]|jgi:hypothetical protein|nr:hypothetical protein [Verrucomicrobiae bacterium]